MPKSKLTSKNQTTVPKEVRESLGVGPSDHLSWEIRDGGVATVTPAKLAFLEHQGILQVGPGSVVEDIRRARQLRGLEGDGWQPEEDES